MPLARAGAQRERTGRFGHRQRIVLVGLVALAEWCDGFGRDDLHFMAVPLGDAGPVMRRGARLKGDQAGTLVTQKLGKLATAQRRVAQFSVRRRQDRDLDDILCQVDPNYV